MAKNKNGGNGGMNGDGGAPAEVSAPEQQPGNPIPDAPPEPVTAGGQPTDIPPDQQTPAAARGFDAMSLPELKAAQEAARAGVEEAEKRLADLVFAERTIEHARCARYLADAKARGMKRAVVEIDGKRLAVKRRNGSDLLQFVDATIPEAMQG